MVFVVRCWQKRRCVAHDCDVCHWYQHKGRRKQKKFHPETCASQHEWHHVFDELFAPFLSSSENWSREIPIWLTFRYGHAKLSGP